MNSIRQCYYIAFHDSDEILLANGNRVNIWESIRQSDIEFSKLCYQSSIVAQAVAMAVKGEVHEVFDEATLYRDEPVKIVDEDGKTLGFYAYK